jgi:long-chain acyl-CoA synthetase
MAETAVSAFVARARADADLPALRVLAAGGAARDETITWGEWASQSRAFAASLIAAGHRPGQHVAILAGNAAAWPIADLGVLMAGGISVGVYPTSAPAQVRQLLSDCAAVAVVVDSPAQMEKVRAVRATLPELRTVICVDHDGGGDAVSWAGWLQRGRALGESVQTRAELARRMDALRPDTAAILIYTSGSTGEPKGAALSHRTLLASAASIRDTLGLVEGDRSLSFLPFCHAAERIFGLYTRIVCGMQAGLVADHNRVWDAAREFAPTLFGGLPRFYEKAVATLRAHQAAATGDDRSRWERTMELGRERSRLKRAGQSVPAELEAEWMRIGQPLLERARELFGGRVRVATSGGAALPQDVSEYLDALGITVLGAYGLTEHLCAAFNRPEHYAFDSAGPPMPGTTLRLGEDGEILLRRGPLTFSGYHGRPDETADAFSDDGEWLRTGDLGRVGDDGALRVIGRKKELIALSNGKKVAPLGIEAALTGEPWIEQAMLYGEGRNFVSALLVIRRPALEAWAAEHARDADDPRLLDDPGLRAAVQAAVDRVNARLSNPERVRRFALLGSGFSGDDLTPTLKLRRPLVEQRYRAHLEALYVDA